MAIGYGNNILYFFVFLLISMGLTGAILTNKNIDAFNIKRIDFEWLFANEKNNLQIHIENKSKSESLWDVEILSGAKDANSYEGKNISEVRKKVMVDIRWTPQQRGRVQIPRIMIQSRFPFKMLRSWKYFDEKSQVIVYPQRRGVTQIPQSIGTQKDKEQDKEQSTEGLFRDFRDYQNTDTPSRIDWKRSLKHQKHIVKNYEKGGEKKVLLDWEMTKSLGDIETRISQLALWVDICHKNHEVFCLQINNYNSLYSSGVLHYKSCLETLALLNERDLR